MRVSFNHTFRERSYYFPHLDIGNSWHGRSASALTISSDSSLECAARLMYENSVDAIPVTEAGCLIGVITCRDLLRVIYEALDARQTTVKDFLDDRSPRLKAQGAGMGA